MTKSPHQWFWIKVQKTDGCWVWTGAKDKDGYGKVNSPRQYIRAHRASWEIHFGPIPKGLWVLHHCDNPSCVRPDHLFVGTALDNRNDAVRKGRLRMDGEYNSKAKLRFGDIEKIRLLLRERRFARKSIAEMFGVSRSTIYRIQKGTLWSIKEKQCA